MHRLLITVLLALLWSTTALATEPATLKVMTFNVRLPADADGEDRWLNRRDLMVRTLREAGPDVFGTQELYKAQGDYLVEHLPDYAWFGVGRSGRTVTAQADDEHMGVFYRKDRLRVIESGNFWLSDTPEVAGSITWGNLHPRMVTWALFERTANRRRFYLFNTHLPYRDQDEPVRERGAKLLRDRIAMLPKDVAVIVTGDFNTTPDSGTHAAITDGLVDAWTASAQRNGPAETFHAFKGDADRRIDWILLRGFDVRNITTITRQQDGRYPSDHYPVQAELAWPAK